MKLTSCIVALIASVLTACAADTVPMTSEAQNRVNPPASGKLAYAISEDGTSATLYVGADGKAAPVADPAALRSVIVAPYPAGSFDVDPGDAVVGTGASGKTYASASKSTPVTMTVTMLDGSLIGQVGYQQGGGSATMPGVANVKTTVDGSVATLSLTTDNGGYIYGISVYPPEANRINDTTVSDFTVRDSLGVYQLSNLRSQLINYYNGNRGEDWSDYQARRQIRTAGNPIYFGDDSSASLIPRPGGLSVGVLGTNVITVEALSGSAPATGSIDVTDIEVGTSAVTLTATLGGGLQPSAVTVYESSSLSDDFIGTGSTVTSLGGDSYAFILPRQPGTGHFYQLRADGGVTSATVKVSGDLEVTGGIILASPNGTRWRISVTDDGVLSASEVTP